MADSPPVQNASTTTRRGSGGRPQCSHTHMDIVHGPDLRCSVCNRRPPLGWLYCCQQDNLNYNSLYKKMPSSHMHLLSPTRTRRKLSKQRKRPNDLESYGFSPSILEAAQMGHYTPAQLELLKKQKSNMNKLVQMANDEIKKLKSKHGPSAEILTEKLAALEDTQNKTGDDSNPDKTKENAKEIFAVRPVERMLQPCQFRVCHTCRPMSKDRTFISFESVFNSPFAPERLMYEPRFMPIRNANLLKNIGLKDPDDYCVRYWHGDTWPETTDLHSDPNTFPSEREVTFAPENTPTGLTAQNEKSQFPRERPSSAGFRDSLKRSLHDMLRDSQRGDTIASECLPVNSGHDLERLKSLYEDEDSFDLAVWKQMADELLERAAAIRLPGEEEESLDELNEPGDEKVVRGGVALTEEAVELDVPDIIMMSI